jgi:hypothetical protein
MATTSLSPHVTELLDRVDLPSLLIANNVAICWRGTHAWASCWMHPDQHPSVQLNDPVRSTRGRWTYFCFGCQESRGDALNAVKTLRGLSTAQAIDYLERFVGAAPDGLARQRVVPSPPSLPPLLARADQVAAASAWIALIESAVPQAVEHARSYLSARGASDEAIAAVGGGWLIASADWRRINDGLARHPARELFLQAGMAVMNRHGHPRALWFDDVVLCASRSQVQQPLYFWGRRLKSAAVLPGMRYCNQKVGGVRRVPFGLDAVASAAQGAGCLRVVEGPITALGSRSLGDGNAAPTMALLHRIGWGRFPDPGQQALWMSLSDDLRRCRTVEICPDNDHKPQTLDQGVALGVACASWLRLQGVRASLRLFQPYHGPVSIPTGLEGSPFGYRDKDFAEVAVRLRQR